MGLCKSLQTAIEDAKKDDSYWIESAKIDFSLALETKRREACMSYAELARTMGTSKAYISKVFRGDANLTIGSMVKLARAVGCNISIEENKNILLKLVPNKLQQYAQAPTMFNSEPSENYSFASSNELAAYDKYFKAA